VSDIRFDAVMAVHVRGTFNVTRAAWPHGMDELRGNRPAGAPPHMEPELVAPMAAFLAHESCPVSAGIYAAGGGRFARLFVGATDGYLLPGVTDQGAIPTPEDVAANGAAINNEANYFVPTSTLDWSARYMSHLF
jgi:hypothetical protein